MPSSCLPSWCLRSLLVSLHTGLFRTNFFTYFVGDFSQTACYAVYNYFYGSERCPRPDKVRPQHRDYVPYSYRTVSGFFNVPYYLISNKGYETGPPVYSPYPRRLESLTICRCNYKGSTFSSVILRPSVLVGPDSNSRPPAWQSGAQPIEPPVRDIHIHAHIPGI